VGGDDVLYVVCGSRHFSDPLSATAKLIERVQQIPAGTHVIHGNAQGADRLAGEAAHRCGLKVTPFPAKWDEHSDTCRCRGHGWCKEAGFRRNLVMLDQLPALVIAFWNGHSTGTLHTISNARERGLPVEVNRL
jgi:hypothetical protein